MIKEVCSNRQSTAFRSKNNAPQESIETRILPNTTRTRVNQKFQKTASAFLDYPAKGLHGSKNSNFYEFLTMGIVPYMTGSAIFMVVFNSVNKVIGKEPSLKGKKFALGVVFYGLMKSISQRFVTKPVAMATGVDIEMPYENIVYPLPEKAGENANIDIQHEQRKVYDSREFYRKDLLDKKYFDKVAKKLGLGDNLNDPVTEVSPVIQNIISTTTTGRNLSSYLWAGVGVGLAVQNCWNDFFNKCYDKQKFMTDKEKGFIDNTSKWLKVKWKNSCEISKSFCTNFIKSWKTLWSGENATRGFEKHAGKGLISFAAIATIFLTANSIIRAKNMAHAQNKKTINEKEEITEI